MLIYAFVDLFFKYTFEKFILLKELIIIFMCVIWFNYKRGSFKKVNHLDLINAVKYFDVWCPSDNIIDYFEKKRSGLNYWTKYIFFAFENDFQFCFRKNVFSQNIEFCFSDLEKKGKEFIVKEVKIQENENYILELP